MLNYLFRKGDGNEGNYPVFVVTLADNENPFAALRALVANRYIEGEAVRKHVEAEMLIGGEADYGVTATVFEGPDGEQAFGAAWITAELEPIGVGDLEHLVNRHGKYSLMDSLDEPAKALYLKHSTD